MARKMQRGEWQGYLDRVSKGLGAQQAELEVDALGLGAQIAHEWAPVSGISYDPKDDLVDVIIEDLDHMIAKPSEIWIDEIAGGLANVEVVDGEGRHHLVKFRAPLALPAP
jgi:Family of unknown function (DUF5335)